MGNRRRSLFKPCPLSRLQPLLHLITRRTIFARKEIQEPASLHNDAPFVASYTNINYAATHNMSLVREHLIEAFRILDEPAATMMMGSMLTIYSVEQVCTDLITPTLWQIGQLWANGQLSVAVEHFASNFFRALLTNLFHVTPGPREGPLTITCCAPGEPHELAAPDALTFFTSSAYPRCYLDRVLRSMGLLHTIRKLSPTLVCISLTMPGVSTRFDPASYSDLPATPAPRPLFFCRLGICTSCTSYPSDLSLASI